ncbi:sugar ABC transporter substrate-binding protein [Betaproteobacteria bacterium]|nr:sugar ABC transporter substrate-binding protein [Betaproteobacteria bacterium]
MQLTQTIKRLAQGRAIMIKAFSQILGRNMGLARFTRAARVTSRVTSHMTLLTGAIVVTGLVAAGCASYPPAPTLAADADYNYLIGGGDVVNVVVWRNPELSLSVTVRPDGRISVPLVEDLVAQGKDATTLARDIEKELMKFIREPVVTVIVDRFVGPYAEQIRVVGEASKPQALPYKQKMTLLDVMIEVGGVTEFADGNGASILRTSEGNKQYSVRINDLIKKGDVSANVEVRPGDVVIIPQSWF